MSNHNRNQTTGNKGYSSKDLVRRLTDRLLKIKAYKEEMSIGDQVDVRGLYKNADYRRDFLLEMMEGGDPNLRKMAKEAFTIDREIQRLSARKIADSEEVIIDQSAGSVHSDRERADSAASRRKSGSGNPVPDEVFSPERGHEDESNLYNVLSEAHPAQKHDQMLAKREQPKMAEDLPDEDHAEQNSHGKADDEAEAHGGHKQHLVVFGVIAALVLLLVLVVTGEDEEGGEGEHAENVEELSEKASEMGARSGHGGADSGVAESIPGATEGGGLVARLPALLPLTALDPTAKEVLRIHGSHAVDDELMPMLVVNYLKSRGATDIKYIGVNPHDNIIQAKLPDSRVPVAIEIESHETSTAFQELHEEKASIGIVGRPITESEVAVLLDRYGNLHSPAGEHIIGMDGLAVIVNRSNPVRALTMEQVAGLFSGGISDWSQVGGSPGPVNIHAREERYGTWDTFKNLVLDRHNQRLANTHKRFSTDAELSDSVAADSGGIGFVRMPYIRSTKALSIADAASTEPIIPTYFNVETEEYPLSRRIFMYTSPREHQRLIDEIVYFSASPEGQEVVKASEFIPQIIYRKKPLPLDHAISAYNEITADAERLSLNFHFLPGLIDLDTKGIQDIPRLAKFIDAHSAKEILLIGFTDNQGKKERNQQLSFKRAEVVAQRMREYGINNSTVKGLGESMPIADNNTEYGRNRNRRVEVWVK